MPMTPLPATHMTVVYDVDLAYDAAVAYDADPVPVASMSGSSRHAATMSAA